MLKKIWEFLCDQDWLIVEIPFAGTWIFCLIAHEWILAGVFAISNALFGVGEIISIKVYGETITRRFRRKLKADGNDKVIHWLILWAFVFLALGMWCHFAS